MKPLGALIRCSTKKQSTASQREAVLKWVTARGFTLAAYESPAHNGLDAIAPADVYLYDEGDDVSGKLGEKERPEYARLMLDLREDRLRGVVVTEVSRLSRGNPILACGRLAELYDMGAETWCLDIDDEVPLDFDGDDMLLLRMSFECTKALMDRKAISRRTAAALNGIVRGDGRRLSVYGNEVGRLRYVWTEENNELLLRLVTGGMTPEAIGKAGLIVVRHRYGVDSEGRRTGLSGEPVARWEEEDKAVKRTAIRAQLARLERAGRVAIATAPLTPVPGPV